MSMETDHGPDQEPEKYSFLKKKSRMKHLAGKRCYIRYLGWLEKDFSLELLPALVFCVKTMGRINISKESR